MIKLDMKCVYKNKIYNIYDIDLIHKVIAVYSDNEMNQIEKGLWVDYKDSIMVEFKDGVLIPFTGIKDSYGNKIYLHDILTFDYKDKPYTVYVDYNEDYAQYTIRSLAAIFENEPLCDLVDSNIKNLIKVGNMNINTNKKDYDNTIIINDAKLDIDFDKLLQESQKLIKIIGDDHEVNDKLNTILKSLIETIAIQNEKLKQANITANQYKVKYEILANNKNN